MTHVYIVRLQYGDNAIADVVSVYSSLEAANEKAIDIAGADAKRKKDRDGTLTLTADKFVITVQIWELESGATNGKFAKGASAAKSTAAASKPKPVAKPTKASGPTVAEPEGADNCLAGRMFCVTGTIEGYTRPQIQATIQKYGGSIANGITKAVNVVVLGENAGPKKLEQIEENGIETVDYEGLVKMIEESPAGPENDGARVSKRQRNK